MPSMKTTILILALALPTAAAGDADWTVGGDLRVGALTAETRSNAGATTDSESVRLRARGFWRGTLGDGWRFGTRAAGVFDTDQAGGEFWLRDYAPGPLGLVPGQATIDEAWLEYRADGSAWSIRFGRFQAAFAGADVTKKSLDQNDGPSFDVAWTDGVHLRRDGTDWTTHMIVRHNARQGPTGVLRAPLDFTDPGSRVSAFLALDAKAALGPMVQRTLSVTFVPAALGGGTDAYAAVVAKTAFEWPFGDAGRRFRLGIQAGHAPDAAGIGGEGWQFSFNLLDLAPRHDLALVYAEVDDGWLLSPDFRPAESLLELRWAWRLDDRTTIDARVRRREEIDVPAAAVAARRSDDANLRVTWRF